MRESEAAKEDGLSLHIHIFDKQGRGEESPFTGPNTNTTTTHGTTELSFVASQLYSIGLKTLASEPNWHFINNANQSSPPSALFGAISAMFRALSSAVIAN